MTESIVSIIFYIRGNDFDVEEVTEHLQIKPQHAIKKGTRSEGHERSPIAKVNYWSLRPSISAKEFSVEESIESLLSQIVPFAPYIKDLSHSNEVCISCKVYIDTGVEITLSPTIVFQLASIGAKFNFQHRL